jgi:hypothetical protein
MKKEKAKNVNLIPLLEGSVIEATVSDGGHSLFKKFFILLKYGKHYKYN